MGLVARVQPAAHLGAGSSTRTAPSCLDGPGDRSAADGPTSVGGSLVSDAATTSTIRNTPSECHRSRPSTHRASAGRSLRSWRNATRAPRPARRTAAATHVQRGRFDTAMATATTAATRNHSGPMSNNVPSTSAPAAPSALACDAGRSSRANRGAGDTSKGLRTRSTAIMARQASATSAEAARARSRRRCGGQVSSTLRVVSFGSRNHPLKPPATRTGSPSACPEVEASHAGSNPSPTEPPSSP